MGSTRSLTMDFNFFLSRFQANGQTRNNILINTRRKLNEQTKKVLTIDLSIFCSFATLPSSSSSTDSNAHNDISNCSQHTYTERKKLVLFRLNGASFNRFDVVVNVPSSLVRPNNNRVDAHSFYCAMWCSFNIFNAFSVNITLHFLFFSFFFVFLWWWIG